MGNFHIIFPAYSNQSIVIADSENIVQIRITEKDLIKNHEKNTGIVFIRPHIRPAIKSILRESYNFICMKSYKEYCLYQLSRGNLSIIKYLFCQNLFYYSIFIKHPLSIFSKQFHIRYKNI